MHRQRPSTTGSTEDRQGWRIPRIEPAPEETARQRYAVTLMLLMALLLFGALIGLLLVPLLQQAGPNTPFFSLLSPAHIFVIVLSLLFVIPVAYGLIVSLKELRRKPAGGSTVVDARCLDRDLQPVVNYTADGERHGWSYRLLCTFEFEGETYRATPDGHDGSHYQLFDSPQAAAAYLDEHIAPDGRCRLRIRRQAPRDARLVTEPNGHGGGQAQST